MTKPGIPAATDPASIGRLHEVVLERARRAEQPDAPPEARAELREALDAEANALAAAGFETYSAFLRAGAGGSHDDRSDSGAAAEGVAVPDVDDVVLEEFQTALEVALVELEAAQALTRHLEAALEDQVADRGHARPGNTSESERLRVELARLSGELEHARADLADRVDATRELEAAIDRALARCNDPAGWTAEEEYAAPYGPLAALVARMRELESTAALVTELRHQVAELRTSRTALRDALDASESRISVLQDAVRGTTSERDRARAELSAMQATVAELQSELGRIRVELGEVRAAARERPALRLLLEPLVSMHAGMVDQHRRVVRIRGTACRALRRSWTRGPGRVLTNTVNA